MQMFLDVEKSLVIYRGPMLGLEEPWQESATSAHTCKGETSAGF